ncbi:MAG: sigma 54-interacting transcriptional regulator [Kiritimatiellae bacterium]|nr:sigma 54-interacting transcriptional regulator [Kiritimatiellia bacterium]
MNKKTDSLKAKSATTGATEIDRLLGGVIAGDNIVWEVDSSAPVENLISCFLTACRNEEMPVVYVSFNHSPQTIINRYNPILPPHLFTLIDCFSSGKGNNDKMFTGFFKSSANAKIPRAKHIGNPADPANLQDALIRLGAESNKTSRYVFDSLTGMLDLWKDEDQVVRFFGHFCPRLFDLNTIACWLLEKDAHSSHFLAKVRHITQVVLEIALTDGRSTITVRKSSGRKCAEIGIPLRFDMDGGLLVITPESREGRELGLLRRVSEVLGNALTLNSFFEGIMEAIANELGMIRGTLVTLDKSSNKIRIASAHGLSREEKMRGEYAFGEGVTGNVVKTGIPEVVPDILKDPRFLDRTMTRKLDLSQPIAFICVPLRVDNEVVGAISMDRPFAVAEILEKDLRLLSIVAAIVSQVLKINRMIYLEKEEILARDKTHLRELRSRYRLDNVIGESNEIKRVLNTAATAAKSRASILVTGETGTGKELIANVVHYNSTRANGPFVKVNCGALPETLLESELFGHVKGAFTGALRDRAGRFALAGGGTIFLDEIGEMSPRLQVKLLRILQEREFEPVGSMRTLTTDVRVVTATSRNLQDEIKAGRFREDLYYRLNVIPIHLPPLRERRTDIPLLVNFFLEKYNRENKKNVRKMSQELLDILLDYPWPGNVRELENCIERAVVLSTGDALTESMLPAEVRDHKHIGGLRRMKIAPSNATAIAAATEQFCEDAGDLAGTRTLLLQTVEKSILSFALRQRISQRELAGKLGLSRMTLQNRLKKYGLK